MDWANVTKIHSTPICQTLFSLLTSMRPAYKDNFATGNGKL